MLVLLVLLLLLLRWRLWQLGVVLELGGRGRRRQQPCACRRSGQNRTLQRAVLSVDTNALGGAKAPLEAVYICAV